MSIVNQVQEVYIAYYGRPADPEGLAFWVQQLQAANGDLGVIIQAFGESEEFAERYGGSDNATLINNIYQNLFGRNADPGGLAFYLQLLETGAATLPSIALQILDGAQNEDAADVAAKVAAANAFTAEVVQSGAQYAGSDAADAANEWLSDIDRNSDIAFIEDNIGDIVQDVLGGAFVLTAGVDVFTGGNSDDLFLAPLVSLEGAVGEQTNSLTAGDSLDGGGGSNRIEITLNQEAAGFQANNIQQWFVRSVDDDATSISPTVIAMDDVSGALELWNDQSVSGHALQFSGVQNVATIGVEDVRSGGSTEVIYALTGAVVTGQTLVLNGTRGEHAIQVSGDTAVTAINVNVLADSEIILGDGFDEVVTLTMIGSGTLDLSQENGFASLRTIDLSDFGGNFNGATREEGGPTTVIIGENTSAGTAPGAITPAGASGNFVEPPGPIAEAGIVTGSQAVEFRFSDDFSGDVVISASAIAFTPEVDLVPVVFSFGALGISFDDLEFTDFENTRVEPRDATSDAVQITSDQFEGTITLLGVVEDDLSAANFGF